MGPAASRLRKDNQAQCQQEASERWNLRPSADDELYHKLIGLIEWAETLLCNVECPKHCKPAEWCDILKRWRDEWHDSHKNWKRTEQPCPDCGGAGSLDSGGVTPWGAAIDVVCPSCSPNTRI